MKCKVFSLFKHLKLPFRNKKSKCVNPLLMGAVLALTVLEPLQINAANYSYTTSISMFDINPEDSEAGVFYSGQVGRSSNWSNFDYEKYAGVRYEFSQILVELPYYYSPDGNNVVAENLVPSYLKLHIVINGKEYILNPVYRNWNNGSTVVTDYESISSKNYQSFHFATDARQLTFYSDVNYIQSSGSPNTSFYVYVEYQPTKRLGEAYNFTTSSQSNTLVGYNIPVNVFVTYEAYFVSQNELDKGVDSVVNDDIYIDAQERNTQAINEQTEQEKQFHEQDKSDAESAGAEMSGFAEQLNGLQGAWKILWYPIEYTNRFVEVFTGGTAAATYRSNYSYTVGYRYNDETGFLEPIQTRSLQPRTAGTGITFPAFEFMGFTIWDSYTYDISQVKEQVPAVFDAIYVIVSILEMMWFVGFLRNKYEEVFG